MCFRRTGAALRHRGLRLQLICVAGKHLNLFQDQCHLHAVALPRAGAEDPEQLPPPGAMAGQLSVQLPGGVGFQDNLSVALSEGGGTRYIQVHLRPRKVRTPHSTEGGSTLQNL